MPYLTGLADVSKIVVNNYKPKLEVTEMRDSTSARSLLMKTRGESPCLSVQTERKWELNTFTKRHSGKMVSTVHIPVNWWSGAENKLPIYYISNGRFISVKVHSNITLSGSIISNTPSSRRKPSMTNRKFHSSGQVLNTAELFSSK